MARTIDSIAVEIILAISEREKCHPASLPPLNRRVDVDALNTLFEYGTSENDAEGYVEFPYAGYRVTVGADGTVSVDTRHAEPVA